MRQERGKDPSATQSNGIYYQYRWFAGKGSLVIRGGSRSVYRELSAAGVSALESATGRVVNEQAGTRVCGWGRKTGRLSRNQPSQVGQEQAGSETGRQAGR